MHSIQEALHVQKVSQTHLRQPRQIHQCQIHHIRTINPQVDWQLANPLVLTRDSVRLRLDLLSDFVEVRKAFVDMEELAPFGVGTCYGRLGFG